MRPPDNAVPPATVTLPVDELTLLDELLTEIDAFLRSPDHHDVVFAALRAHSASRDRPDAGYLIDAVQLNAAHLRRLIAEIDGDADLAAPAERVDGDD